MTGIRLQHGLAGGPNHLAIDDRCRVLTIMEMLHLLIHIVFLANFGTKSDSHLIPPIVTHLTVGVLVGSKDLMDSASLLRLNSLVLIIC